MGDCDEIVLVEDDAPPMRLHYSLLELRRLDVPEPVPVVEDLVNEGETVLLVGRPKVGKSLLTMQLAISLSRGEAFLGKAVPKVRKVLLIDLENRPSVVKDRANRMAGPPRDSDCNIDIYAPETLADCKIGLTGNEWLTFNALVADTGATVVVIDTWRLLLGSKDENRSEVVVEGLKQLSRLRIRHPELTIVIVHHLRKQNSDYQAKLRADPHSWVENVSGHHALVGHVDRCYGIEREIDRDEPLIVFGGVARNASSICMILESDEVSLSFQVAKTSIALRAVLTTAEQECYETASQLKSFTFTELFNKHGKNKKAVANMLRKAVAQGVLEKPSKGGRYVLKSE
jgi:AAA domain